MTTTITMPDLGLPDFILYALAGGSAVAAVMGATGVFVVWRRMAFFGGTLGHSALLGVALGFLLGVDVNIGIVGVCLAIAIGMVFLRRQRHLAEDTLLGILAHSSLALGLIVVSFVSTLRVDLMSYLFGDVLAISRHDLVRICASGALMLAALAWLWRDLVAITVHEDLARIEGVKVLRAEIAFMTVFALVIALAMKVVGILLVTALLIIPAAAARAFSRTPEQMATFAAVAGALSVALGLGGSLLWNLPSGPAIVCAAALLYVLSIAAQVGVRGRA